MNDIMNTLLNPLSNLHSLQNYFDPSHETMPRVFHSTSNTSISSLRNTGADENDVFSSFLALLSYDGFRKGDT